MGGAFGGGRDFTVRGEVILADKASKVVQSIGGKLNKFGSQLMTTGSRIRSTGQSMTIGLTAPIVGGFIAIIKKAGAFQDEMAKIIGLSNASADQVALWREELLDLAVSLGKSPQELAEGLFFLASAGLKAGTEIEILALAGKASVAGLGEVSVISQALTNVIAAYGQENVNAADAVGIMIAAIREGNLETDEMTAVFGRLLPLASELDISFAEITGALSALSLINADASENATAFLGIMRALIKPSEQGKKVLDGVGTSFEEIRQSIKERGLIVTLTELRDSLGGIEDVAKVFPRVRGLTGLLNLTGEQAEKVDQIFRNVAAGGAADLEKAFEAAQTPAQRLRQIMARLDVAIIRLAPVIDVVADVLSNVIGFVERLSDKFAALSPAMQKTVVIFAIVLAALGPILIVIGALIAGVGVVATVFGSMSSAIGIVLGFIALFNPVTLALIAIVLILAAVAFVVWKNWSTIMGFLTGAWQATSEFIVAKVTFLKDQIVGSFQVVRDFVTRIWGEVSDFIVTKTVIAFNFVRDVISSVMGEIRRFIRTTWGAVGQDIIETLDGIRETAAAWAHRFRVIFGAVFDRVAKIIQGALDIASVIITSVFDRWLKITRGTFELMRLVFTSVFDRVVKIVQGTFNIVRAIFEFVFPFIRDFVQNELTLIGSIILNNLMLIGGFFRDNWRTILAVLEGVWEIIVGIIRLHIQAALNVIEITMAILRGDWGAAWEAIKDLFSDAWDAIKQILSGVLTVITSLLRLGWEAIKTILTGVWNTIKDIAQNRWNLVRDKIVEAFTATKNKVSDLLGNIKDAVTDKFNEIVGFIFGLRDRFLRGGKRIMDGLESGVTIGFNFVLDKIEAGVNRVLRGIAKGLGVIKGFADAFPGSNPLGGAMQSAIDSLNTGISVPRLAHGGFVAETGLAVVHKGETYSGVGGGASIVIRIDTINLGGRATSADAEEFIDMVETKLRARRIRFQ